MTLAEKIIELLKTHDMSQRALALAIGETPQQLNRWLQGTGTFKPRAVLKIARVFGVEAEYLLDDAIHDAAPREGLSEDEKLILRTVRALGVDADEAIRRIHGRDAGALPPSRPAIPRDQWRDQPRDLREPKPDTTDQRPPKTPRTRRGG
jgi:transcriptional regulator with XRE-family HTH domain